MNRFDDLMIKWLANQQEINHKLFWYFVSHGHVEHVIADFALFLNLLHKTSCALLLFEIIPCISDIVLDQIINWLERLIVKMMNRWTDKKNIQTLQTQKVETCVFL